MTKTALIIGAGAGLSASLARLFAKQRFAVALAARDTGKLTTLADKIKAKTFVCDVADPDQVKDLFEQTDKAFAHLDIVIYNPSYRVRGPFLDLEPSDVSKAFQITAFGAFLTAQEAIKRMLPREQGALFFTGASASVKGYPLSAPFAMGKFALRGLVQSIAREFAPRGIHVAHFIIDGGIKSETTEPRSDQPDSLLDPDAIAETYYHIYSQPRSAWTWEVELRPWVEKF